MAFLAQRDRRPELMDQPGLDAEVHRHALVGLRKANKLSRTAHIIWRAIQSVGIAAKAGSPLRVLDIATGGGDVLMGVARLAARYGVMAELHGCDVNATAVEFAQHCARRGGLSNTRFFLLDALTDPLPGDYDVVMSTLFVHHLSDDDACELLRTMADCTRGCVLVDDLRRNRLGYSVAWAGVRLLTRSRIVHVDGPLSVRSAFTISEMSELARAAGLVGARFQRHWPERFLLSWRKL